MSASHHAGAGPDPTVPEVEDLVEAIRPLLAGRGAKLQGYVLAELVATWVLGHVAVGDVAATKRLRAAILAMEVAYIRRLVKEVAAETDRRKP